MKFAKAFGLFAAGCAAAFYLDPVRGHTRRVQTRDKVGKYTRKGWRQFRHLWDDILNRSRGFVLEQINTAQETYVDDNTIEERIRSKIGHVTHDAGKISVTVNDGVAVVSGLETQPNKNEILQAVKRVRGVRYATTEATKVPSDSSNMELASG